MHDGTMNPHIESIATSQQNPFVSQATTSGYGTNPYSPGYTLPSTSVSGGTGGQFGGGGIPRLGLQNLSTNISGSPTQSTKFGGGFGTNFSKNMGSPQAMAGIAGGVGGILQGLVGRTKRRDAQTAAQTEYDKMLSQYQELDTSNIYANVENQYADMENAFEDLTVNQQQAQFEAQQGSQQRANIMQSLKGAAGGSGIAGLAQAMANQGQLQTQRISASIGMQEQRNQAMMAQEASRIQLQERMGEEKAETARLGGAETARGLEWQKTGTMLGMSQQQLAGANQAIAQSDAALWGGVGQIGGTLAMAAISDRRLKKNIHLTGQSPNGLNIYNFEYIDSKYGEGLFQGVMSNEIPREAVLQHSSGYDMVDYNMIDVEFKKIN